MTQPDVQRDVPARFGWRFAVGASAACAVLGLLAVGAGAALPAPIATLALGAGIVGASFLLSWAGDAAEVDISGGLVLAGITFLTVLPELVIEVRFAFTQQTSLVSANLTGATRLLLTAAVAMPLLAVWLLARRGEDAQSFSLPPARRVDLAILFIAALYGIVLALLERVTLLDGLLLIGLYVFFLRRVRGTPDEPPAIVGVSAGLAALSRRERWTWIAGMVGTAVIVIVAVAEPFAVALQETGAIAGVSPYLVVQSIVPAATEAPEFVVAAVLALNHRPAQGLAIFLAAAVTQWTFALGVLPFAYAAGGGPSALPLQGHDPIEVALTVSTTLMAVAALSSLKPLRIDSWIVVTVWVIQFAFPAPAVRIAAAVVLAMFTVDIMIANRRSLRPMFAALRSRRPPPDPPD
jgi:cation:H+ antiporter